MATPADHGPDEGHDHAHHGPAFYIIIGVILAIITFVELGPLFHWFHLPASVLLLMSAAKFILVVAFFMHLWGDAPIFSWLFYVPLLGATLMIAVLMLLFHTYDPAPWDDPPAVQERYWSTYSQPCHSWLRSHATNKWYCASPPIESGRMAAHVALWPVRPDMLPRPPDIDALQTDEERLAALMEHGEEVYGRLCAQCHRPDGTGSPGAYPPLAGAVHNFQDPALHASIVIRGSQGRERADGTTYAAQMPAFDYLDDVHLAAIITYERMAWGNNAGMVLPADVAAARGL